MLISQSSRFAELQSRIQGRVLVEGDDAWQGARQTFNVLHDQRPAALVRVASAGDVAETVRYAARAGLRIAPQSTGHNAGPIAGLEDALLVRTDDLQEVTIDVAARRARVGSGVRWGAVADPASEAGLAPLSGSSRDVGITGYSLGGGMGWLGRKHGLQVNALTAIEIVTADGQVRRIDHDNETDLFWAVRGGGGDYGVVTALEFELFPAEGLYAGSLFFPFERSAEIMHAWHELTESGLPGEVTSVARIVHVPPLEEIPEPLRGNSFVIVQAAYLGSEADGAELMRPISDLGPVMNTFAMVEPNALGWLAMDPESPMPYASSARMVSSVTPAGIDAFLGAAGRAPAPSWRTSSCGSWAARSRAVRPAPAPARSSTATTCCSRSAACSAPTRTARSRGRPRTSPRPWRRGTPAIATSTSRRARSTRASSTTRIAGGCSGRCGRTGTRATSSSRTTRSPRSPHPRPGSPSPRVGRTGASQAGAPVRGSRAAPRRGRA